MNTYKNSARHGALSKLAILVVDLSVLFTTRHPWSIQAHNTEGSGPFRKEQNAPPVSCYLPNLLSPNRPQLLTLPQNILGEASHSLLGPLRGRACHGLSLAPRHAEQVL